MKKIETLIGSCIYLTLTFVFLVSGASLKSEGKSSLEEGVTIEEGIDSNGPHCNC